MKVIKASSVLPENDGYICYLTRKEAIAIKSLTGLCSGPSATNPIRNITDGIFHRLAEQDVPFQSITVGAANIPIHGDIE